jgi:hypothetical protein
MYVEISEMDPSKCNEVCQALCSEWDFSENYYINPEKNYILASGTGCLSDGLEESEFAEQLKDAVFAANGAGCEILVKATYLDDLPYETYHFCKDDYKEQT